MGSYGIGPGRLMGTVVEVLSDEKGMVWPQEIAPFAVHVVELGDDEDVKKEAEELYRALGEAGVEALYDDRDARAGEKFAASDLIGIPLRVVVSQKTLTEGKFECVERASGSKHHPSLSASPRWWRSTKNPARWSRWAPPPKPCSAARPDTWWRSSRWWTAWCRTLRRPRRCWRIS